MMKVIQKTGKFYPKTIVNKIMDIFSDKGYDVFLKKFENRIILTDEGEKVRISFVIECEKEDFGLNEKWKRRYSVDGVFFGEPNEDLSLLGDLRLEILGSWAHDKGDVTETKSSIVALLRHFFGKQTFLKKMEEYHKAFKREWKNIVQDIESVIEIGA